VSTHSYRRRCIEAAAVRAYRKVGIDIRPGMTIEYVVADVKRHVVEVRDPGSFDYRYYLEVLERAWTEIEFLIAATVERDFGSSR